MNETLYIKLNISEFDALTNEIRNAAEEIDENNYLSAINEIKDKYSK